MNQIINLMKQVKTIIDVNFKQLYEYKSELLSNLLYLPLKILISYLIWSTLYKGSSNEILSFSYTFLYFIILALLEFMVTPFCSITYEMMNEIKSGDIDMYITRPFPYLLLKYLSNAKTIIISIPVLIIVNILVIGNLNVGNLLGYILMNINATIILFSLFALMGLLSFKVENVLTFRDNLWNIIKILSGSLIPLSFYSPNILTIIECLPFEYIYYKPITFLLNGGFNTDDILMSVFWVIVLVLMVEILWKISLRKYSSQGG